MVMSGSHEGVERPKYWDKWVSAAYLRIMGATQIEAAKGVGRSERTLQRWEEDEETWRAARKEAEDRWLVEVKDASRRSVLKAAGRNAEMGLKILERIDPALAPPKQKVEHGGEDGGPIEVVVTRRIVRTASSGDGN